jgi:predicted ATPase
MSLLIGRDDEISRILKDIQNNLKSSAWLVTGESGIGKSAFLDEIYSRLQDKNSNNNQDFVGYYSQAQSLMAPPSLQIYPFNIALSSLIMGIKDAQNMEEKAKITINRLEKAFVEFAKEK